LRTRAYGVREEDVITREVELVLVLSENDELELPDEGLDGSTPEGDTLMKILG